MKNLLATTAMTIALTVGAAYAQTDATDPTVPETGTPDATTNGTTTDGMATDGMTTDGTTPEGTATDDPATGTVTDGTATDGTATDGTATDGMDTGTTDAPAGDMPATDTGTAGTADDDARLTISPPEGYAEQDVVLTTDNLEGATVYDVDGDDIGEVHGLIFANGTSTFSEGADGTADDTAEISHAILDIGGWLGIGQHRVAIPLSDLVVYTNNDDAEDVRIYLPRTQEQLEALPEFDEDAPVTVQ